MKRHTRIRSRRRSAHRGFTLMEVLLVLAILVILGSLVVANFGGVFNRSKINAAKAQISAFETQLDIYQLDIGSYPTPQQGGLQALRVPPADLPDPTKWGPEPYARKDIPPDPWSNPYYYEVDGNKYKIYSAGPDGQPNTSDDIISISG